LGSTRGLWEGESAEDYRRLLSYGATLERYTVVTHSYKRHALAPRQFSAQVMAIPTDAWGILDSFVRMLWIGWRALRERRFDVIQAQDPFAFGVAAVLLGKLARLPVNVCVYGPNVWDPGWLGTSRANRLLAPIGRWVLRRCQGVQVDGKMTARSLAAAGIPEAAIALKPVVPANLPSFYAIDREAERHAVPRLLFVGRLVPQKNLPVLLEAARRLHAEGHRFELELVGEGALAGELRAIVARTGLADVVRFRGPVSRDAIPGAFAAADLFVLTSDSEGYARVLMEAAAAALPIVTTAVSGSDDAVVDGETGYIVPLRDVSAVVEKLALLLRDPALRQRLGHAARAHIRPHADPALNTPAQLAIWQRVAGGSSDVGCRMLNVGCSTEVARDKHPTLNIQHPTSNGLPRHLLLFNLATDARHPILGFTTQWIRELAARVESIHVITMWAGEIDVPPNVRVSSAGRERGWSEPRRFLEFYRHLFRILRTERIDGCFSHMIQIFSVLAGPVLRWKGIPLVTWYAHPKASPSLRLSHWVSDRIVTSLPRAYPYRGEKVVVIGQGIDTALFAPAAEPRADDTLVLCVGRISRVKNHATLLRAFAPLPPPFRLAILGATAGPDDAACLAELRTLATELGIAERVAFEPPVPATQLPAQYRRCAVHVNLTGAGFGDKVAWEAMACGRPCLVANDDFRETLGRYEHDLLFQTAEELTAKLRALLAMTPQEREVIGQYQRAQVERLHSLPRLAERILEVIASCQRSVASF
jgi:glycosyltransferase involved in cell wall biosynthesis